MSGLAWTSPMTVGIGVLLYLIGAAVVGLYFGRAGARSEEGYFVADRNLGRVPLAFSILATIMSAGIFTGTVGLFYKFGAHFIGYTIAYCSLLPLIYWVVGRRLWGLAKQHRWVTLQGFLGDYYGSDILRLGGAIVALCLFLIPYFSVSGVVLGVVLEQTVGVPYNYGVWLMLIGTLLYAAYGGMAAVAYTDVYQGVIMVVFVLVATIALLVSAGGMSAVMGELPSQMTTLQASDNSVLYLFYGWLILMGLAHITHPDRMTRIMAARDLVQLRKGMLLMAVLLAAVATMFLLLGLTIAALIPGLESTDQALPRAISDLLPILVPLFVVVIWAAGMSTIDSGLVAATTIFTRDIVQQYLPTLAGQRRRVLGISRAVLVLMALLAGWIAIGKPPFIWDLLGLVNSVAIQYFPALLAGLYWRGVTKAGAEAGWIVGIGAVLLMEFLQPITLPTGIFSGMIILPINALVLVIVSLVTRPLPVAHVESYHGTPGVPQAAS